MRHLPRLIELVSANGPKEMLWRARLERRHKHSDEVELKRLRAPKARSREDVERVLACQKAHLTPGVQRLQLVPTLLQLAGFVKESIPVTSLFSPFDVIDWKPTGNHPLVIAWDICITDDPNLVWDYGRIVSCSELTVLTAYLLAKHIRLYHADLKICALFTAERLKTGLGDMFSSDHFLSKRIKAFVRQEDDKDEEMCSLFGRAMKERRWDIVLSTADLYDSHAKAVFYCARGGNLDLVKYCLWVCESRRGGDGDSSHGDSSQGPVFDGETPLHWAARGGALDVVKFLTQRRPADVNASSSSGRTPLYKASTNGHVDVVMYLLENGADVGARRDTGSTAFIGACNNGHLAVVQRLLQSQVDVNAGTRAGETGLHFASWNGFVDIVKLLVLNGANVNVADNEGRTPLIAACEDGHLDIVKILLENGADGDCRDKNGLTPLCVASACGRVEIVRLLLDLKVDVNSLTIHGVTALMLACMGGHVKVIDLLLDFGGEVNVVDCYKKSALHFACVHGIVDAVQHLLWRGADYHLVDVDGESPLSLSCAAGHVEIVKYLMLRGAQVRTHLAGGPTPLFLASRAGHLEVVKILVHAGAELDAPLCEEKASLPFLGFTPLLIACFENHANVVKYLLDTKANVECVTRDGLTLAMLAAAVGNLDCMQELPRHMLTQSTKEGLTALHIAEWTGQEATVRFLKAQGCVAAEGIPHSLWQCHVKNMCSCEITGKGFAFQASFQCLTCWSKESLCCICSACARSCHKGHKLTPGRLQSMFCDCADEKRCILLERLNIL
jgi:ankyrin repeat protein